MRGQDAARERLRYAKIGWATFPVHGVVEGKCTCGVAKCASPGKHPRFAGKDHGATVDQAQIGRDARFKETNIGILPGASGLVVVDIDMQSDGYETLLAMPLGHTLPRVVAANTGGGGEHVYFKAPPAGVRLPAKLGRGIDLLSGNRFPVAPPSRHASGANYEWQEGKEPWSHDRGLPDLPAWILQLGTDDDGQSLDDDWPSLPLRQGDPESPRNVDRLRAALGVIPADCSRNEWRDVIFSIHSTGWKCAEELARDWSMSAPARFTEEGFANVWGSAVATRARGRGVGSIFHEARELGWTDPTELERRTADLAGDITNSRVFAAKFREELLFVRAEKSWFHYSEGLWSRCGRGEEIAAAKRIADEIVTNAADRFKADRSDESKKQLTKAAVVHTNAQRLKAMVDLATAEPALSVPNAAAFDKDPWLLGVPSGAIDLRTGHLLPPLPSRRISKQVGVPYDASATCPRWEATLLDIFGAKDIVDFVARAVGYTLSGSVDEEKLFFAFGSGANGKSLFANVVSSILGSYATTVSNELISITKHEGEAARAKTRLVGTRMALVNEVGQNETWNDQRIKEVVSRERIPARQLYAEAFDFFPTHKLWIRGNHMPAILDASDGMWRRIVVIPFNRQFGPGERVLNLDRQLVAEEGSGILNWALRGCRDYLETGLAQPPAILALVGRYRDNSDVLGEWITRACAVEPAARAPARPLYESYREHFLENGMHPRSGPAFSRIMTGRGFRKQRSNGQDYYVGIRLA